MSSDQTSGSDSSSASSVSELLGQLERLSVEDDWIKDHPWEDAQPSYVIENVQKPAFVEKKYCKGKMVDWDKVFKNLPKFIQKISAVGDEEKSSTPAKLSTMEKSKYEAQRVDKSKVPSEKLGRREFIDIDAHILKIWIPESCTFFKSDGNGFYIPKKELVSPNNTSWIFTPSYLRSSIALVDWSQTGIDEEKTVRIVVVRPDQFDKYIKYSGQSLPIISLPENSKGVGYARYWIQKIATSFALKYIWMIDDSVLCFLESHPTQKPPQYSERKRNFEQVLSKMERYVQTSYEQDKRCPLVAISPACYRPGSACSYAFTPKPPVGVVYLNIEAINAKNISYRPELKLFEDMLFAAECVKRGELRVMRWNRIRFFDKHWKNSGAAVYRPKATKSPKKETPKKKTQGKQRIQQNTGEVNTDDQNTGEENTDDQNTGEVNTDDQNAGEENTDDQNTGSGEESNDDQNTGSGEESNDDQNTGSGEESNDDQNTGPQETKRPKKKTTKKATKTATHRKQFTDDQNTGEENTDDQNTGSGEESNDD